MSEQISTIQTREVLELMRNLAPILNQKELFEFMLFSNRVVERYMPEHYNDGLAEEVVEMRKDKAWLIQKVSDIFWRAEIDGYFNTQNANIMFDDISNLIDELDEPEVLSQKWVDENVVEGDFRGEQEFWYGRFIEEEKVRNLLVPEQDNGFVVFEKDKLDEEVQRMIDETYKAMSEKPVIPKFVADCIEEERANIIDWHTEIPERFFLILGHKLNYTTLASTNFSDWIFSGNEEKLYRALKYGYEVEKEPVYYAKIKGHELVETGTVLDDDTGNDVSEFHRNIYFVLQRDGDLIVDMKDSGLSGAKHVMTMNQWNSLGINETNADFEEVTE